MMFCTSRLLLALLVALAAAAAGLAAPVQLSSSVMMFNNAEAESCPRLLRNAASHGSRSVNIVVTSYWVDERFKSQSRKCNPDGWAESSQVDYFCYYRGGNECQAWNRKEIAAFTRGLSACLTAAFDLFDEVLLSPHLDDGTRTSHWRNMLIFDPLDRDANGWSYHDIMVRPLSLAAAEALAKNRPGHAQKTLWFSMQGEMGGTVFHYPLSYSRIARRIRSDLAHARAKVLVGVLLNHAYLPGLINRGPDAPPLPLPGNTPMAAFSGGWGPLLPLDQWPGAVRLKKALPAARALLRDDVDFLGISNYNRAPADVKVTDMEAAAAKYDAELAAMGIDLLGLIRDGTKFIHNEVAVGGGVSECGDVPATQPWQVGRFPWMGMFSSYKRTLDPFQTYRPASDRVPARDYMRAWYSSLLELLSKGGLKYPVSGSYIWNCASWDVQAVYTSSGEGSYADPVVVDAIRRHNAAAAAAPPAPQEGGGSARGAGSKQAAPLLRRR